MNIPHRLDRLEAAHGRSGADLKETVLRACRGDPAAMRVFATRARPSVRAWMRGEGETDPDLAAAIAAVPVEIRLAFIRQAELEYGTPMSVVAERLGAGVAPGVGAGRSGHRPRADGGDRGDAGWGQAGAQSVGGRIVRG